MSSKRKVPTFKILTHTGEPWLEGPVVSPDKTAVAQTLTDVHTVLQTNAALLVYDKQWCYIPVHAVSRILRGQHLFTLPWPLVEKGLDSLIPEDKPLPEDVL